LTNNKHICKRNHVNVYYFCGACTKVAGLLLDAGANADMGDNENWTALHFAADKGLSEAVTMLVDRGHAHLDAVTAEGYTTVFLAAQSGHVDTTRLLINLGASTTVADNDGWTPLHAACGNGHLAVVGELVAAGVDVNARSHDGLGGLYLAAQHGRDDILAVLLDAGCLRFICTPYWGGGLWRRGSVIRTSVFGWRTFPDLRLRSLNGRQELCVWLFSCEASPRVCGLSLQPIGCTSALTCDV